MNGPTLEDALDANTVPTYVNVKASVHEATMLMKENRTTAVLVKDTNEQVAGIFTSKDVVLRVIAAGLDPKMFCCQSHDSTTRCCTNWFTSSRCLAENV